MAKTVVGLFDDIDDAQRVVDELTSLGIPRGDINIVRKGDGDTGDRGAAAGAATGAATGAVAGGAAGLIASLTALAIPGFGPVLAAGPLIATLTGAGIGAAVGGLIGAMVNAGVPEEEAEYYNEGVRRGGTLVMVRTSDELAERAAEVMNRHNALDIDERAATWRSGGWSPRGAETATTTTATAASTTRPAPAAPTARSDAGRTERAGWKGEEAGEGKAKVPVVQENLNVGKRQVRSGGVRVYAHMTERPVSEDVALREEKVNVERRPVNRPASEADLRDVEAVEEVIEVVETREVPVVEKQARVVEEVVVDKNVEQRKQTVRDTVKQTDVRVEQMPGQETRSAGGTNPDFRDDDYRDNFTSSYAGSGMTFEQVRPAYEYGSELARDQRYRGRDWAAFESDARRDWESRHPGGESTWDKIKGGVRYAWDRARAKV